MLAWVVVPACGSDRASRLWIPRKQGRFVETEPSDAPAAVVLRQRRDRFGRQPAVALAPTLGRIHIAGLGDGQRLAATADRGHGGVDGRPRTVAAVPVAVDDGIDQPLRDP